MIGFVHLDGAETTGLPLLGKPFAQQDLASMIAAVVGAPGVVPVRRPTHPD